MCIRDRPGGVHPALCAPAARNFPHSRQHTAVAVGDTDGRNICPDRRRAYGCPGTLDFWFPDGGLFLGGLFSAAPLDFCLFVRRVGRASHFWAPPARVVL